MVVGAMVRNPAWCEDRVMRACWSFILPLFLLACDDPKLDASSNAIQSSAEECLLSVRDRRTKYEATPTCVALDALATTYLREGGGRSGTPAKYELRFVSAQRMAWTALAMSESCSGKPLKIW
jgi:hypothetical protein